MLLHEYVPNWPKCSEHDWNFDPELKQHKFTEESRKKKKYNKHEGLCAPV